MRAVAAVGLSLAIGYALEGGKLHLNHYLHLLEAHPEFAAADAPGRAAWWQAHDPVFRVQYFEVREAWPPLHRWSVAQVVWAKWMLAAAAVVLFFVLDLLLLRVLGAQRLVHLLVALYLCSGVCMGIGAFLVPGPSGYALAREFLGFLQSPLPSLFVALVARFRPPPAAAQL